MIYFSVHTSEMLDDFTHVGVLKEKGDPDNNFLPT
jgi:hypothetical protein